MSRKCRCHVALFIFTYLAEDGSERCITCNRVVRAAASVKEETP